MYGYASILFTWRSTLSRKTATTIPPSTTTQGKLETLEKDNKIFSHIRKTWLNATPEERVRQAYVCTLVNEYDYSLEQMSEEVNVGAGRGTAQARADIVIWGSITDKQQNNSPLIVVECKSDNVTISENDYFQGENYTRMVNARFFVTHNNLETRYWRVHHHKMPKTIEQISAIPHANDSDKEIQEMLEKLKTFKEDEFADLLHKCHNIIRNRDKLDPAAAFDEIAKILFVKVHIERDLKSKRSRQNHFTEEYLNNLPGKDPINLLFSDTKDAYKNDQIFRSEDRIALKSDTSKAVVKELQSYNLSDTSEDIKGIAFERFLGRTFRGEIGQFFTPRPIVEFMIRFLEPHEGQIVCDPASGSGGFLIRFFEIVREQILKSLDDEYQGYKASIETDKKLSETAKAEKLTEKYEELQKARDQKKEGSRL
jgi:type I restriction enzyme M protein